MQTSPGVVTFLFTDIEGSTRLWEQEPERMRLALAQHDSLARDVVKRNRGTVVKMAGDGVHAAFADPLDAVKATLELQRALADPATTNGLALKVRCGLHVGADERRDNDFFGRAVNRAARIMSAAHGGQILASEAVALLLRDRTPEKTTLRDLGAVRLRDLAEPERVYQVSHAELRQDFPALRSLEATPNNLPQQVTSFVGRERELAEVESLLGKTRLLTLVGPGGIGKTRLSLQVAANAMDAFPDGVWFVELAPLTDAQRVPQTVASVLGVKEEAGRPVIEALLKHLKDRQLLLVLDNCEHLLQACAELARQMLRAAQKLKILASSREHLRTSGEQTYAVPALSLPDANRIVTVESLTEFGALRLFVERAIAVQPAFEIAVGNAVAVTDICRRLDGIPLAIELAAARVRALSVEAIAERLSDRFRLLGSGDRTALPRQQTLRALIDWSYDLLTEAERTVLRRLALFAGGWTLEAAEAVAAAGDVRESDVLDLMTRLVEKSLVVMEPTGSRYRLLDTVREYAQERLEASGEADAARDRHLAFYLTLTERARPELDGPQQGPWLARLDLERENVVAAHAWCDRAASRGEVGLRLADAMEPYWINRGLLGLGHKLTVEALARQGAQKRGMARCRGFFGAGQLCYFMGRYDEAQSYLHESLAIAREIGDTAMVAIVLQPLGLALQGLGDPVAARGHLEEGLALAEGLGNKRELAAAINALAQLDRMEGRPDTAKPLYEKVLSLARELGDRDLIAVGLLNLAMVSIGGGSVDRVGAMLLEVLAIADEIGSKPAGQSALEVLAGLGVLHEDWTQAARFFGAAEAQAERTGLHRDPADEAFLTPLIAKAQTALGSTIFAAVESAGRALPYDEAMIEARSWLVSRS
jgi:predicted ATPase/class 3 adenylate cyclase